MKVRTKLSFLCRSLKFAMVISAPAVLLATGCGGSGSMSTPPAEKQKPVVSVSASPSSVTAGSSSKLTVSASQATSVTLSGSDGATYTMAAAGGTQLVTPSATTTYTASATGAGGAASATAMVTVNAAPPPPATVTIAAAPDSISAGGTSMLTIVAANAADVTVNGSDGSVYKLTAKGGMQSVSPAATTTYTASATGPASTTAVTAKATVTVLAGPPATVTIAAGPASIVAGGSSTLTIEAANATTVTVTGTDKSSYTLAAGGGTQSVSPAATTTYSATAAGPGGNATATAVVTVTAVPATTVTLSASPTAINLGASTTLTVAATNATGVVVTGTDKSTYTLSATGGTQSVTPTGTTTYTATATGASGTTTATQEITVGSVQSINHVILMLQENRTFDSYFGMLNPYREANSTGTQPWNVGDDGKTYNVDGIDDKLDTTNESDEGDQIGLFKLASSCIDDDSSAWLSSYGDANRYDFSVDRKIKMDGFVHTAEGFANSCRASGTCSGAYTEMYGERAMGYYDEDFLNYYYYMASQFAVSDRWFSPIASKSTPNRIATYTGGTTQGLVYDPGYNDHIGGVTAKDIFQVLDAANVSWKVYYSLTQGQCGDPEDCTGGSSSYPATDLGYIYYDDKYIYKNPTAAACKAPTVGSAQVGDSTNSYCIDPAHVGPLSAYYTDVANGTLASFSFIEAGYGLNDEHPGSFQPILLGQAAVSKVVNALMNSPSWKDSVFFFSYDEGGGPYDHVPPIPGHSNDFTDKSLGNIPDIASISVSPDAYGPCLPPAGSKATQHCDLRGSDPGANPGEVPDSEGFGGQIGFRVPNIVISPFTRRHYVSHIPMDHTAVIKFVENRFIGPNAHLTARDAAQPNLLDFFDFTAQPWAEPPTPPTPATAATIGHKTCNPATVGP